MLTGTLVDNDSAPDCVMIQSAPPSLALAISHDCDITNEDLTKEPCVEFVYGRQVDSPTGDYLYGKNPRLLHLPVVFQGQPATLELHATARRMLPKALLHDHAPDARFVLSGPSRDTLQSWLAARYRRQALPNALVDRLRPVFVRLTKIGKQHPRGVLGYWFDVDPKDVELPAEEPYELRIWIVYTVGDDPVTERLANEVAGELRAQFTALMAANASQGPVELRDCRAVPETSFTLWDMRRLIHYRYDYLSYRQDPPGPVI